MDGYVTEIAVVDTATDATLLDTLVNPGCPIQPSARAVHGISDADVADVPAVGEVLPQLLAVTRDRTVLAYNAAFDSEVIVRHTHRDGLISPSPTPATPFLAVGQRWRAGRQPHRLPSGFRPPGDGQLADGHAARGDDRA